MDGAGEQFLARPALTEDEHRNITPRDAPNRVEVLHHRRILRDNISQPKLLIQPLSKLPNRAPLGSEFRRPTHDQTQLVQMDWFFDVVVCALLQGLPARVDGGMRGGQNHLRSRCVFEGGIQNRQPVGARTQHQVGDHDVEPLPGKLLDGRLAVVYRGASVVLSGESFGEGFCVSFLIFDNQNVCPNLYVGHLSALSGVVSTSGSAGAFTGTASCSCSAFSFS